MPTTENAPFDAETDSSSNMVVGGGASLLAVGDLGRVHRWDGATWTKLAGGNHFDSIVAISSRRHGDAWTVRREESNTRRQGGLRVEHHQGADVQTLPALSQAALPRFAVPPASQNGVQLIAFGTNDVWLKAVVDTTGTGNASGTYSLVHWDGATWSVVLPPALPKDVGVSGIWASASNDLWVSYLETSLAPTAQGFLRHWDGKTWTTSYERFAALGGTAADNVWAVGAEGKVYRWDGRNWTALPFIEPQLPQRAARVIVPVSRTEAWVSNGGAMTPTWHIVDGTLSSTSTLDNVGWASGPYDVWFLGTERPSLRRWDGLAFVGDSPPPVGPQLFAIDGIRTNDMWVGGAGGGLLRTALGGAGSDTH